MKLFWQQLAPRERQWVGTAIIIALLYLGYIFIWQPWQTYITNTQEKIAEQQQILAYLNQLPIPMRRINNSTKAPTKIKIKSDQLLNIISVSLENHKLQPFVSELSQQQSQEIHVKFSAVGFDNLISWLYDLWQIYTIKISSVNLVATNKSGEVKAEINLILAN